MSVKGYGCESAHASGDGSEQGSDYYLTNPGVFQSLEYKAFGFDVDGLDHHHHDGHESGYEY